jgi:hypothetical protein
MNAVKIAAIVLIVAGVLGLAYGSFSYTKENHEAKLGPIELSVKDKQTVNVPVWAGVGAIVIGGRSCFLEARRASSCTSVPPRRCLARSSGSSARGTSQGDQTVGKIEAAAGRVTRKLATPSGVSECPLKA